MIHYSTPSRLIGKYTWRMIVLDSERGNGRVTDFEWCDNGNWRPQREWPTYDFNDGCFAGCPKGLRKIWEAYRPEIEAALEQRPVDREPTLLDRMTA